MAFLLGHPNKNIMTGEMIGPPPIPPAWARPTSKPKKQYLIHVNGSDKGGNS